jgi:hypothetical protein
MVKRSRRETRAEGGPEKGCFDRDGTIADYIAESGVV